MKKIEANLSQCEGYNANEISIIMKETDQEDCSFEDNPL